MSGASGAELLLLVPGLVIVLALDLRRDGQEGRVVAGL